MNQTFEDQRTRLIVLKRVWSCVGFYFNLYGFFFNDINSTNEILLTFIGYGNTYSIGNVQPPHEHGLETEIPNVDGDFDGVDEHVIEVHLENLWKQKLAWKPHYHNSITWEFFKVNDNQFVNLSTCLKTRLWNVLYVTMIQLLLNSWPCA